MTKDGGDCKMEYPYKEVYFDQYCKQCNYKNLGESEPPCDECLRHSMNYHSHKPVNFEKNPNYKGDEK